MGIVIESEFTEKMFETYPTQVYVNPSVPIFAYTFLFDPF